MSDQEKNPYALYPEEQMDRRPRYYDGQFLGSADFIDAQRYDIDRRRRHIRATVRPGVVVGLDVVGAADRVTIAAGAAVDDYGRQIVLVGEEEKGVREIDRGKNLLLYIAYGETTSDQSHSEQGTAGYTRFHEMPAVDYVEEGVDLPAHAVLLAALTVGGDGAVTADNAVRPRAGVLVPGATPLTLTSNDADPGRATLAAALQIDVPEGTRSNTNYPALRVGGDATVTASMRVGQVASTGYGGVQTGDDGLVVKGPIAAAGSSAVRGLGVGYSPHADEGVVLARRIAIGKTTFEGVRALDVVGNSVVDGNVLVTGWGQFNNTLLVNEATTLRSSLSVAGAATVGIDLGVTRNVSVGGNTAVTGDLTVTGRTSIDKALTVGQTATIQGATTVRSTFTATGWANVGGAITVGGTATIGGNTAITGSVSATTSATFGTTLSVAQGATIGGGASVGAGLTVGGNVTVQGNTLDLGAGAAARVADAGKIAYRQWSDGLDIVGGGTSDTGRSIKLWAETGVTVTGPVSMSGALSTGGGATIGGNSSVSGTFYASDNSVFRKGLVIGQTETTGYGAVQQDGNDLVVNGQFAAGGSGGAAMYSLAIGRDAIGNKEGYLFVNKRIGIGVEPDRPLQVSGNSLLGGAVNVTGRLTVAEGTDNGIRFPDNIGGGGGDWAGLRYWATSGEDTRLELGTGNDPDDILVLRQQNNDVVILRQSRIGLGGEIGDSTVRIHGNVQYDYGCYAAMGSTRRIMVAWAAVNSDQTFWNRGGIDRIVRNEKGRYQVYFSQTFSGIPAVVVTQHGDGNTRDNCLVYGIGNAGCWVKTGDSGGDRSDRAFTLIAIGPR